MSLQDTYRSYEKELNAMKAELKETVNKLDMTREREYQDRVAEFKADYERYNSKMQEFRSQFNSWRTGENLSTKDYLANESSRNFRRDQETRRSLL